MIDASACRKKKIIEISFSLPYIGKRWKIEETLAKSMSPSLKALMPGLARLLGISAPRLYERHMVLVYAGLLKPRPGRGPGSGVAATAPSVALLVIAGLASDALAATEERTRAIANAVPASGERCPLTDTRTFRDALANLFTSRDRSSRVIEIRVSRTAGRAAIVYRDRDRREHIAEFVGANAVEPSTRVIAYLDGSAVKKIATDLVAFLLAPDEPDPVERGRRQCGASGGEESDLRKGASGDEKCQSTRRTWTWA